MSVELLGDDELRRTLLSFDDRFQRKFIVSGTRAAANVIKKEAIERAPRREGSKVKAVSKGGREGYRYPGYLKANIKVVRRKKSRRGEIQYDIRPVKFAFYGLFLEEYGSSSQASRPWLRPAFESKKTEALNKFKEVISNRIDREWQRGGR